MLSRAMWSSPFNLPQSLLRRFTSYVCILSIQIQINQYKSILLFLVILYYMSKLFLGLHCAGKSYTHLLEREAKGQLNDVARVSQL